jgi:hypothetical protein
MDLTDPKRNQNFVSSVKFNPNDLNADNTDGRTVPRRFSFYSYPCTCKVDFKVNNPNVNFHLTNKSVNCWALRCNSPSPLSVIIVITRRKAVQYFQSFPAPASG